MGPDLVLLFITLQVIAQRRNQSLFVEIDWTEVKDDFSGLVDRRLKKAFGLLQGGQCGRRPLAHQLHQKIELVIEPDERLHEAVMNVAGDPRPLLGNRDLNLFYIESIETLVLPQMALDLLFASDLPLNKLPHHLGARSGNDRGAGA